MLEKIIMPLITTVVSTVLGTLISIFLTGDVSSKSQSNNNSMLQYNKHNTIIINSIYNNINLYQIKKQDKVDKSKTKDDSWGEIIILFFVGFILVDLYLKYELQIIKILLLITFFVIPTSLSAVYFTIKKGINIDKHFKMNLIWIIIATIFVPIILYFLNNPLYLNGINKSQILNIMETKGNYALLSEYGFHTFGFLLYQVIGIITIILFIVHLHVGSLHSWAMINLYIGTRFKIMWSFIFRKTYKLTLSSFKFIGLNIILLIISFLMCSGLLYKFILFLSEKSLCSL